METLSFKEILLSVLAFSGFVSGFVGLVFGLLPLGAIGFAVCVLSMWGVCEE